MRLVVPAIALLAGACTATAPVNVDQERTALLQRDRDWAAAATSPDQFVAFLAPDATIYPTGMPAVSGVDNIRKMFTEMSSAPGFAVTWTADKATVGAAGDIGVTTGTYEMTMGGVQERGKYVTTWTKVDNAWMVSHDIFNPNGPPAEQHALVASETLTWGDAPPGLPPGARIAVVSGDPSQAQPFVMRAQMPAGYRVPLHWHPTTENLTILSGTAAIGMGDGAEPAMKDLTAGSYAVLPAEMRHVFATRTAVTMQVHGIGPFAITYVNPADDPRQQK
jgi:ketosteroid isomerase-like protein